MPALLPLIESAEKENRRPPFTTAAERFTFTRDSAMLSIVSTSMPSRNRMRCFMGSPRSELQAAGARGVGQRLDAAVVAGEAAVEHDRLHAGLDRLLRDLGADHGGALRLVLPGERGREVLRGRRRLREGPPALVVDDLRRDVLQGPRHAQAREHRDAADVRAPAERTALASLVLDQR